ncbi:MAG: hypothetical protein R3B91_06715 [Planctomycetaceae bacterium]
MTGLIYGTDIVLESLLYERPVPDELEKIVLRCLEKAPSDRYPDAQCLSTALSTVSKSLRWNQSDAAEWWRANPVR